MTLGTKADMRRLNKPGQAARSILLLCAECVRDKEYSKRLVSVADNVAEAEAEYAKKGEATSLFTIVSAGTIAGCVTIKDMEKLYTGTFSRKNSPVRYIYDEIKLAPRNSICPLCAQRVVSTLDHYLPKSRHPAFAVTPLNLIPSCTDCNKAKLDLQPANASELRIPVKAASRTDVMAATVPL